VGRILGRTGRIVSRDSVTNRLQGGVRVSSRSRPFPPPVKRTAATSLVMRGVPRYARDAADNGNPHDTCCTEPPMARSHKHAAVDFLELAASGKVDEAYRRYVGPGFRHHNPFFPGDAGSLMRGMRENALANPGKVCEVKMALEEADRVAVFSHVRQHPDDRGAAVVHIFRFDDDGRIVEFWDVGQPLPEQSANDNGMF
jgi:predicted SnoaL-like aldol condensation-catalyzing enzyme